MHETKTQLRIIAALLIAVIALATGLLFYDPTSSSSAGANPLPSESKEHDKVRDAIAELEPSLVFSQTFGGSGDETITDVFFENERFYIFGNTTSNDFDFEQNGAFLAIIESSGKTVDFFTYGGTLKAVTLYSGGFLMALDDESPTALAVNYFGAELKTLILPCVATETTLDVKYSDGNYAFITALTSQSTKFTRIKLTLISPSLEKLSSVVTDEVYDLEYVDTLNVLGSWQLIANAKGGIRNMLCVGEWNNLAYYPKEFSYVVKDFWITDKPYYLIQSDDEFMLLSGDGNVIRICESGLVGSICGDDEYLYVSVENDFYCLRYGKTVFSENYGPCSFFVYGNAVYSVCSLDNTSVRSFSCGSKALDVSFNKEISSPLIFVCPVGAFVMGTTDGVYGGKDCAIFKINC